MWMTILVNALTSTMAKQLIALAIKKLLEHKEDGITKEIAESMLDGIAQSRANNAPSDLVEAVKGSL